MSKIERIDGKKDGDQMKLNKKMLKEMIRDVLQESGKFTDSAQTASTSTVRRGAMAQAKEQSSGLTDDERGLIKELIAILTAAAKKTNIASGRPAQKINQLAAILNKVAGEAEQLPPQGDNR